MGGPTDKNNGSFYVPLIFNSASELQTIYAQSWAARKFIDIPVDDQFILGRTFESDNEDEIKLINDFEAEHNYSQKLADAQKAGRLYGDALLWFVTAEDKPETPLDLNMLRPGDLRNIIVVDRYDISTVDIQSDPLAPGYLEPITYNIALASGRAATVHNSRVIRFQGKKPLTSRGFQNYGHQWFGISQLTDTLTSIMSDSTLEKAIGHLVNEASIPVAKLDGFQDTICKGGKTEDLDLKERLQTESMLKSLYRTTYMDKEDDFTRVSVAFSGLPDLVDRFSQRLASAADIPQTRFLGQSPQGMSATGESDMKNYALSVQSMQEKILRPAYDQADPITGAILGIPDMPDYDFPSLVAADDKAQADALAVLSTGLSTLLMAGTISEGEAREVLRQNPLFSSLEETDPEAELTKLAGEPIGG